MIDPYDDEDPCGCAHFHEGASDLHRRADLIACEAVRHDVQAHVHVETATGHTYRYGTCRRCGELTHGRRPELRYDSSGFRALIDSAPPFGARLVDIRGCEAN